MMHVIDHVTSVLFLKGLGGGEARTGGGGSLYDFVFVFHSR